MTVKVYVIAKVTRAFSELPSIVLSTIVLIAIVPLSMKSSYSIIRFYLRIINKLQSVMKITYNTSSYSE